METQQSLKERIDSLVATEHANTERLAANPSFYPVPTRQNLFDRKRQRYDASRYVCVAFRRRTDYWKNWWVPFGNMNSGFDFEIGGVRFPSTEHAYMCGMYSTGRPRHIALQQAILDEKSAYIAKRTIRSKNFARWTWHCIMLEWMLYCVWEKTRQSEEFRRLLMAVPRYAVIIEDSSFNPRAGTYWGCVNPERKAFASLARKYVRTIDFQKKQERDRAMDTLLWDFCNFGVFEGRNQMGKILTYIKECLHQGTEPEIDYELLNRKKIHLLGRRIEF